MRKIYLTLLGLLCLSQLLAQNDTFYYNKAQEAFEAGNYEAAQKWLNVYSDVNAANEQSIDDEVLQFEYKIKKCVLLISKAKDAESDGRYGDAILYYEDILQVHPTDPNMRDYIMKCKTRLSEINSQKYVVRKRLVESIDDVSFIIGFNSGTICGDYLGFYTELKLGNPSGVGFEFGYSPGLGDNPNLFNFTAGVKGYLKGWYLSTNFGTTLPIYGEKVEETVNPDGTILKGRVCDYGKYGFDFLLGFDKSFRWFHFEVGAGITIPTQNTKILPAWTIGIGIDYLKLKF